MDLKTRRRNASRCAVIVRLSRQRPPWLPMPFDAESRKLSVEEWLEYRARCACHRALQRDYDAAWRRPTANTAEKVWQLLAPHGLDFARLTPSFAEGAKTDERADMELTAKQALVVVLDCAIRAGRRGGQVTYNMVFDALAAKWSDWYRRAEETSGARQVRDMRVETAKASRRDLLRNGVLLNELWEIATGAWSRKATSQNPLYWLTRLAARGYRLDVNEGSPELAQFERLLRDDPSYSTTDHGWRLLLADDPLPTCGPRAEVCAERAYNVVQLGEASKQMLALQTETRLLFDASAFVDDYRRYGRTAARIHERLWAELEVDADAPSTPVSRGGRQFASDRERQVRGVPIRLRAGVRCLLSEYDEARRFTGTFALVCEQAARKTDYEGLDVFPIKTGMYRVKNRRYQPTHFWPSAASGKFYEIRPDVAEAEDWSPITTSQRAAWFAWVPAPYAPPWYLESLSGRDVSGSQTQILAALLGLDDLGAIATTEKPGFNQHLAQCAWRLHIEGKITLNDGYTGADDLRLKALVKNLWMRVLYGSQIRQVIRDQDVDPRTFGPGWINGEPATKAEYVAATKKAEADALTFLLSVPEYEAVDEFLHTCQRVATIALKKDPFAGVVLTDPFDGAEVRWNPVKRTDIELPSDGQKLILSLPGTKTRRASAKAEGEYAGDYPVDGLQLTQMVAPCLVHMLDAYFSSLVMKRLAERGVRDFVGIHDCWLASAEIHTSDGRLRPDLFEKSQLEAILQEVAGEWFKGLGPVYDRLLYYLDDPGYGDPQCAEFIHRAKAKWTARVQAGRPPYIASAPSYSDHIEGGM